MERGAKVVSEGSERSGLPDVDLYDKLTSPHRSLIWNIVASKRWEKGGGDVMVGDLVVEEERDKSVKHSQRSNKKVLEVTAENISGYTMKDVVISLPGSKVVVPSVYVGLYADACREIGLLGEGVEMDMKALFSSTVKDFNLGGDYRRILGEARDMDCEVLEVSVGNERRQAGNERRQRAVSC